MVRLEVGFLVRFLLWPRLGWAEIDAAKKWTGAVRVHQQSGLEWFGLDTYGKNRNGLNPWVQPAPVDRVRTSLLLYHFPPFLHRHRRLHPAACVAALNRYRCRSPAPLPCTTSLRHDPALALSLPAKHPCPRRLLGRRLAGAPGIFPGQGGVAPRLRLLPNGIPFSLVHGQPPSLASSSSHYIGRRRLRFLPETIKQVPLPPPAALHRRRRCLGRRRAVDILVALHRRSEGSTATAGHALHRHCCRALHRRRSMSWSPSCRHRLGHPAPPIRRPVVFLARPAVPLHQPTSRFFPALRAASAERKSCY